MHKTLLISVLVCQLAVAIAVAADPQTDVTRADRIHDEVLTIDTHCDTPMMLLREGWDINTRHSIGDRRAGTQDLPRMREGGLDASFFAVFVGQGERTPAGFQQAREQADRMLAALDEMFKKYPDEVELATSPEDIIRISQTGKRVVLIGMENGYPLGKNLALLDQYYRRGVRYVTLCHTSDNDLCDSSTDHEHPEDNGLSDFGRQVVHRMNDLGMIVDVSHLSDRSFYDVLKTSRTPVLASHSCARAVCDNPRNLNDDMLRALKDNGGVIQLCILSDYIKKTPPNPDRDRALATLRKKFGPWEKVTDPAIKDQYRQGYYDIMEKYPRELATVKDAVDHIDHIVKVIGIDHVGIGTDFDGGGGLADCRDVTELRNITRELVRRGYSKEDIAKIWGGNFMRLFRQVIAAARPRSTESPLSRPAMSKKSGSAETE